MRYKMQCQHISVAQKDIIETNCALNLIKCSTCPGEQKYAESYIKFNFTYTNNHDGTQKLRCFTCGEVLCDENRRSAMLQKHVEKNSP
jgi:uncharacterized C2H2 Zn-finger protein